MGTKLKKFIFLFSAIIIVVFFVFKFGSVYAFDFGVFGSLNAPAGSIGAGWGEGGISSVINTVFNTIITIAEVAFVLMFLIGGVMYLTAMGDEEGSKKAKKLILDAVIGIVIVLSAWAIGTWVLTTLRGNSTGNSSTNSGANKTVEEIIKNIGKNNGNSTNPDSSNNSNETNGALTAIGYSAGVEDGFTSSLCSKIYNINKDTSQYSSDTNYKQSYDIGFLDGSKKYQEWTKNSSTQVINATKMSTCPNAL